MRKLLVWMLLAGTIGCGQQDKSTVAPAKNKAASKSKHDAWWCNEHGIPETECSMCSAKVAAAAKQKGDWCDKHERARSQCFVCEPGLKEKYAALYRARYGKEPPAVEE